MNIDNPITIDDIGPPSDSTINIDTGQGTIPVSPKSASNRAAKAQYGMGGITDKVYDDYVKAISDGNEQGVRQEAASAIDFQKTLKLQQQISNASRDFNLADTIKNTRLTDPNSVFEDAFSVRYVNSIYTVNNSSPTPQPYSWLEDAVTQIPEFLSSTVDLGRDVLSKTEFSRKQEQDAQDVAEQQSWGGFGVDLAKQLVPGYMSAKLRGNVGGYFDGVGLLGENLEEQRKQLYNLPYDEFKQKYTEIMDRLKSDNPQLAVQFAHAMSGLTSNEAAMNTIFEGIDITAAGGLAKLGARSASKITLYNTARNAIKDVVSSSNNILTQPIKVAAADGVGDLGEAAVQKATVNATADFKGISDPTKRSVEALQTMLRPDINEIRSNPGRFGQEIVNRIEQSYNTVDSNFIDKITNTLKNERIPEVVATENGVRLVKESIRDSFPGRSNMIIDIGNPVKDRVTNSYSVPVSFGRSDGELFHDLDVAKNAAEMELGLAPAVQLTPVRAGQLKKLITNLEVKPASAARDEKLATYRNELAGGKVSDGYIPRQKGAGWYIEYNKTFNETDDIIRDGLIPTTDYRTQFSNVNAAITRFRTPEATLSKIENQQRKITTHAPSQLAGVLKSNSEAISNLPMRVRGWLSEFSPRLDFERVLKYGQTAVDPDTGKIGYMFKSPGEVEDWYLRNLKRSPYPNEITAYFAVKKDLELDRALRSIRLYTNKARLGGESHRIWTMGEDGNRIYSNTFDGIVRKKFPGGGDTILVMGDKAGEEKIYRAGRIDTKTVNEYRDDVDAGIRKVIEVISPSQYPLQGFTAKISQSSPRVRWIVTKNSETKPLSILDQVPRRGGGHFEYDYEHYIKQARITEETVGKETRHWYDGDTTLLPVGNRAMGQKLADRMNAVRELIRDGKINEARLLSNKTLPYDWDQFFTKFAESKGPNGETVRPQISLHEPIQVVPINRSIVDLDNNLAKRYEGTFKDGTRQGALDRQVAVKFTGERDALELETVFDKGTRGNPVFQTRPAEKVDPISSLNRGLAQIVNSTFTDDMKIYSMEHWLAEATPYLDTGKEGVTQAIRHSPYYYFENPKFKKGTPVDIQRQLESNLFKIKQFNGVPNNLQTFLHSMAQKMSDSLYNNLGPKGDIVPVWMLPKLKDPFRFIRSVTVHEKLGLFNLPQYWTQASTYVNVVGMSGPQYAPAAITANLLHLWGRFSRDPAILDHLDNLASRMRIPGMVSFKPGQFKEANQLIIRTGFYDVGGEHGLMDAPLSNKPITNAGRTFLDWGMTFFREGAQAVRSAAFYTAYLEFRKQLPTAVIGDPQLTEILSRAAILDHNMSRASNSALQTGILSVPMQFASYRIRLAELMFGKTITPAQKVGLFATTSLMYGVPFGGLGLVGLPVSEYFRQKAIENGYVVGNNFITSLFMEGVPATLIREITGINYNIGQHWGTGGLDVLTEALDGSKSMWNVFGGASINSLSNAWAQSSGFRAAMMAGIRGDSKSFPLKPDDFLGPFKEVSSISKVWQTLAALNTGNWYSRNENIMDKEVGTLNAVFMGITGLQSQQVADTNTKHVTLEEEKKYEAWIQKSFTTEFHRGIEAQNNKDPDQAKQYFTRAFAYLEMGGYPQDKKANAIAIAAKGYESMIERTDWSYYMKDVPETRGTVLPKAPGTVTTGGVDTAREAYKRTLQIRNNK